MDYTLRLYRDGDAERLSEIMRAAIETIGSRRYSTAQVAAWGARAHTAQRFRERVADGAVIFIAADANDEAAAYSLLEPDGHLDHLYSHPDHSRQGLPERVLAAAEQHARERGITRLYTEASELARAAFKRAGYVVLHRRDFEIPHGDTSVPIHNYAMEKPLG